MLTGSTPEEDRIVEAHSAYLKALRDRGGVLLAGRALNADPTGSAIVFLRASSKPVAPRCSTESRVHAGSFCAELVPGRVALVSEKILY